MARCPSCQADNATGGRRCARCGASIPLSSQAETAVLGAALSHASGVDEGRFPPGTILAQRYRIAGLLGRGGMGEVYKATDLLIGQTVAMKFLPASLSSNQAMLERFRNEVRVARQVSHPSVCRVYDLGEADGDLFLTMEFVDGEDLESLLRRVGPPAQARAVEMARRICAGLHAAHERGILHRDFKPANIMIDGRGQVRIMDFGLAAAANQLAGDVRSGTPAYMAPEQLSGTEVTALSDIYALGLVLHELFTGRPPFAAASLAELRAMQQSGVEPVRGVEPAIGRTIERCLDPEPRRRPATALAVAAALPGVDPLQAVLEAGVTPSPDLVAASGERTGMNTRAAAACLAVLFATLLCAAWLGPQGDVFRQMPADLPPDALALRARDHLAAFGYPPARNTTWNFSYSLQQLSAARGLGPEAARARLRATPPAVVFWLRTGPQPLTPWLLRTVPAQADPPPEPGYVLVQTDTAGRLVLLEAYPREQEPDPAGAGFDFQRLFAAAGLEMARFEPVRPAFAPWSPVDERAAWMEKEGAEPLRVEAAHWRGRPVFFRISRVNRQNPGDAVPPATSQAFLDVFLLVTVLGSTVLAWRNLRLDRGDRRGALRIGLFVLAALLLAGLLPAEGVETATLYDMFAKYAGWCLYWSAATVLAYLAVEPYVRRNQPRVLIGWTRFWNGEIRDPLVGSDVLVGLAAGGVIAAVVAVFLRLHGPLTFDATGTLCNMISGPGQLGSLLLVQFLYAVPVNLLIFFLLFAWTMATGRRSWAGGALYVLTMAPMWAAPSANPFLAGAAYALVALISLGVFLRFGILAGGSMFLVCQTAVHAPLTLDRSAWYFGESMAVLTLLAAAGVAAFRIARR